ncbi:hypothetical protein BH23GEM9_BH23GEM9_34420 [soil metagenome]
MSIAGLRSVIMPLVVALGVSALYACGNAPDVDEQAAEADQHAADTNGTDAAELATLRQLTAGYTDIAAAQAAGYTAQITPCWYHGEHGGQGVHFARTELIDGTVSLNEPEIVMYEPRADGTQQFLAIEYIVPFAAWDQAQPPSLLGRDFMRNERLELWVLHVWLGKENPSGMYADWNPNVTCTHAAESEDRA